MAVGRSSCQFSRDGVNRYYTAQFGFRNELFDLALVVSRLLACIQDLLL
jgi:hypothetical protein